MLGSPNEPTTPAFTFRLCAPGAMTSEGTLPTGMPPGTASTYRQVKCPLVPLIVTVEAMSKANAPSAAMFVAKKSPTVLPVVQPLILQDAPAAS